MTARLRIVPAALSVLGVMVALGGCGAGDAFTANPIPHSDPSVCQQSPDPATAHTLFVLDWTGGTSTQTGDTLLTPFNVAALRFSDDSADDPDLADRFADAVLARVQLILCDLEPADIAVVAGEADDYPGATIVHLTGDAPPAEGKQIGQSDFDACNERLDDAAVIWGGALAARIPPLSFDQWVNAVANTTAHEIGHTLGFRHPAEDTVARLLPVPAAEIMRSNVKPSELAGEQYFILPQETCPGHAPGEGSYASAASVLINE